MRIILRDDKEYTKILKGLCSAWGMSPTQVLITLINKEATNGDCNIEEDQTRRDTSHK